MMPSTLLAPEPECLSYTVCRPLPSAVLSWSMRFRHLLEAKSPAKAEQTAANMLCDLRSSLLHFKNSTPDSSGISPGSSSSVKSSQSCSLYSFSAMHDKHNA